MTTIAYDVKKNLVACDARWSADFTLPDGRYILLVDDTGFNKIAFRPGGAIFCAGDGKTIELLKKWWLASPFQPDALPAINHDNAFRVTVMIVSSEGETLFEAGPSQSLIVPEENPAIQGIFTGSGGPYARRAFMQCGCVKAAISAAEMFDPYSGGQIKFCHVTSGDSNLQDETMDYMSIMSDMDKRGILMKYTGFYVANSDNVQLIPLREHPQHAAISEQLQAGTVRAYAPQGGPQVEWTAERITKLKEAARKVAGIERRMKP